MERALEWDTVKEQSEGAQKKTLEGQGKSLGMKKEKIRGKVLVESSFPLINYESTAL